MYSLRVVKVLKHNPSISTIYFSNEIPSYPGQFIMLNVFNYEEIPLSLSSQNSVTVKVRGETTKVLANIPTGSLVGVRGPFGRGFTLTSKHSLIVAGGIGIAPLLYLYICLKKINSNVLVLYGAKTREDIIFKNILKNDVIVATEDGSEGFQGTVVDLLLEINNIEKFDKIYCCGPEGMLKRVYKVLRDKNLLKKSEFSLERYIKCGIGICGTCVLKNGKRVCKDGPVFNASELAEEFED